MTSTTETPPLPHWESTPADLDAAVRETKAAIRARIEASGRTVEEVWDVVTAQLTERVPKGHHQMLARIRKAMDENEQGFTLIELLVVMIIIGILAAIAIPVFLNQRKNAVDASYKSDLRTVANEMESYYTDNEIYPAAGPSNVTGGVGTPVLGVGGASGVRVSKNTFITVSYDAASPNTTAYCLTATNQSNKGSHDWFYISSKGGLQPASTLACSY